MNESFFLNGQPSGDIASRLLQNNFDPGCLRPFIGRDGRSYMTVNTGRYETKMDAEGRPQMVPILNTIPTNNAVATLPKDIWIQFDNAVMSAALPRLKAFGDLRSSGLVYSIPNGMAKTILQYQTTNDINDASISMDGRARGESDRLVYDLRNLPLPIISKDFQFSAREIATSRNGGYQPVDTAMASAAARKVAEQVEKLTLGIAASYQYGGGTLYGYRNFPKRLTKTLTCPVMDDGSANSSWTPATTLKEVLEMKAQSVACHHHGPWRVYCSPNWDTYMDNDFNTNYPGVTLRERLLKIQNIQSVDTLDYLTGWELIMIEQSDETVRAVIGMDLTTLQWESEGGMMLNFKVMCIMVPQLRYDMYDNTGIVHGVATPGAAG